MNRYFIVYKPYRMLSQFVSPYEHRLLGDLDFNFPAGTQAVGRLDEDSEGLLILTTDKKLTNKLLHPDKKHIRKYLVMVQGIISDEAITKLKSGTEILLKKKGSYTTNACEVKKLEQAPDFLPQRENMYAHLKPHSWLEFTLTEGKNRQIRKMCTAVNHKCKRLVRTEIEKINIYGFQPGEVREISPEELNRLLF